MFTPGRPLSPTGSKSPDLRGAWVRIEASDDGYEGRVGQVVDQVPCDLCGGRSGEGKWKDAHVCGHDDLILELDEVGRVRVYEPEVTLQRRRRTA